MTAPKASLLAKLALPLCIIFGLLGVILLKMGFIFVLLALLPSLAALFMDNDPYLPTFKTVLACNCAALLPVIFPMLKAGVMFEPFNSYAVISDPFNWLVAYGGAAIGWCLIFLCRFMAQLMVSVAFDYQIQSSRQDQERLVKEWGKEIIQQELPE